MLSKRYDSTEVDRRTWLHVPSWTRWSTSSDTHQVVEMSKSRRSKWYTNERSNVRKDLKTKYPKFEMTLEWTVQ